MKKNAIKIIGFIVILIFLRTYPYNGLLINLTN